MSANKKPRRGIRVILFPSNQFAIGLVDYEVSFAILDRLLEANPEGLFAAWVSPK